MSWETLQLGEFLTLKGRYDLPSVQRENGDVPIISSSSITGRNSSAKVKGPDVATGRYGTLMYLLFNVMSQITEIRSNAKGTTYPEISKERFRWMDVVVPLKTLVNEFARVATDIIQQVRCLKGSTLQLEVARDPLLPCLMNGEVAV